MTDASRLRVSEVVGIVYFAYIALAALLVRLPTRRRIGVWVAAVLAIAVEAGAGAAASPVGPLIREWLPAIFILVGYFATGLFYVKPSANVEAWLKAWDERLIGGQDFGRLSPGLRLYLDVAYNSCSLIIPIGFLALLWSGGAVLADRFWTLVLTAEFLTFSTLPWLQARPPWAIEQRREIDRTAVRRFSLFWVNHTSIRATTFPSGHASGSLAVAIALIPASPSLAAVFAVISISIAVGSVVGRFHYAIDAVTGLLLAVVVWLGVSLLGF